MSTTEQTANAQLDASTTLANLYASVPLMRGSLVASVDGRVLAAELDETRQDAIAAVVASGFALGGKLAEVIGKSGVDEMTVHTDDGAISLYSVGDRAVLATMAMPDANLGLLNLHARKAAETLSILIPALLEGSSA